ncbi:MAG: hypothetical protein B6241_07275 [Spirochaetaceae bacterium 4572_59]|nr:MAG: hypothetical protein B6241_07275 [Spirochaetaceae bacterium 4572_59]
MAKKLLVLTLIVFLLLCGGAGLYIYQNLQPLDPEGLSVDVKFVVEKGEPLFTVLDRMERISLIKNAAVVKAYVRFVSPSLIKNGNYQLSANLSPFEILDLLVKGRQELIKVTIPEGFSSRQIAQILQEKGIISSSDGFVSLLESSDLIKTLDVAGESLEGYLFPDTYYFQKDFPEEKVISYMVNTFFSTLESIFPYYGDFSEEKMREKLILASIIEKEYRVEEEAPLMASVFYNRLNIGMPLQSCATVIYVITEELGRQHPGRIFKSDLKIESAFNTYYNQSLPPGPICNPGKVALDAAFNPAQTDYLFFVVKNAARGTHTFTSTLSDHNQARQLYLSGFRSK